MQEKNNNSFEQNLQDILKPDDPNSKLSTNSVNQEKNPKTSKSDLPHSKLNNFPKWLDISIRIAALIIVIVLLMLFAIHIATR